MDEGPAKKKQTVIRTPDHRLRVFISSTLRELAEERNAVRQAVEKLRLIPVMFEAGARPHPPRELYQAYLSQSHIFIGLYWQSYGWVGPGMSISGLEDEYNLSSRLPRLIYIKSPAPDREPGLQRLLARLQDDNTASYKHFSSVAELGELVENDLALLLTESYEAASKSTAAPEPVPLTNLPMPRNPLLGRELELQTLCDWLSQPGSGFVTLTGTAGAGKSRLALEAALKLRDDFPDGAFLVQLSPVTDPARVVPAIAEALGVREGVEGLPVGEILARFLHNKRMLLLLDNFEHVLPAARQVGILLEACPQLKMLVTSRAALHLRSEKELLVQPLAVPGLGSEEGAEQLSQYASVELFIQRAQSIHPDFRITEENASAIAEICYRLDGLPLAIELAAARTRLLRPQDLLARLGRRFELLRGGTRDLPERQQTLRSAIDWSYDLLTPAASAVLRQLSVFPASWSLEAAEAICDAGDGLGSSILEQVEALADSSMIVPLEGPQGEPRFRMLQSIREYALERLEASGESAATRDRHLAFFRALAAQVRPHLISGGQLEWMERLDAEHENMRAALAWAQAERSVVPGLGLAIDLEMYLVHRAYLQETCEAVENMLAFPSGAAGPALQGWAHILAGYLQNFMGHYEAGREHALQAGRLFAGTASPDLLGQARARLLLIYCDMDLTDDPPRWRRGLEEILAAMERAGDPWWTARVLFSLGIACRITGDYPAARGYFERSLDMFRGCGDAILSAEVTMSLGILAFQEGDYPQARRRLEETLAFFLSIHLNLQIDAPLWMLGVIAMRQGDHITAASYYKQCVSFDVQTGLYSQVPECLVGFAGLAQVQGQLPRAAQLLGAAGQLVAQRGNPLENFDQEELERLAAGLRRDLGDIEYEACTEKGRGMSMEQAAAFSLEGS